MLTSLAPAPTATPPGVHPERPRASPPVPKTVVLPHPPQLCFNFNLRHYTTIRQGDKRIVKLKEGDPVRRHVVIVDDLVQSGGTLIECQRLLSRLGAAGPGKFSSPRHCVLSHSMHEGLTCLG